MLILIFNYYLLAYLFFVEVEIVFCHLYFQFQYFPFDIYILCTCIGIIVLCSIFGDSLLQYNENSISRNNAVLLIILAVATI